jgi:hypothetical protein
MHNAAFTLNVRVESTRELLFKLGPPHVWWLHSSIEQILNNFIGLANQSREYRLLRNARQGN